MWLSGLHVPESYLTALVQATCRRNGWPLDRSTLFTQVTKFQDADEVTERAGQGAAALWTHSLCGVPAGAASGSEGGAAGQAMWGDTPGAHRFSARVSVVSWVMSGRPGRAHLSFCVEWTPQSVSDLSEDGSPSDLPANPAGVACLQHGSRPAVQLTPLSPSGPCVCVRGVSLSSEGTRGEGSGTLPVCVMHIPVPLRNGSFLAP